MSDLSYVRNNDGTYSKLVQLSGSIPRKYTLETLANAQSASATGGFVEVNLNITNESEVWLFVNIDQQPWTLNTTHPISPSIANESSTVFPKYSGATATYANPSYPATGLLMGQVVSTVTGLTAPTTLKDAKDFIMYTNAGKARVINNSASIATVTIKIVRIWR